VHTAGRLREAGPAAGLKAEGIAAAESAFSHVLRLRLDQQRAAAAAGVSDGLKLSALHEMDKAILREALKQARRLQQRLKLNYAL
jgi:CBS domain-containing protein